VVTFTDEKGHTHTQRSKGWRYEIHA
jgi:hypothetical protein